MENNSKNSGYLLVFLAGVIWGFIGLFVKLLNGAGANATTVAFMRMSYSTVIMLVISVVLYGGKSLRVDRKTLLACAFMGLVCQCAFNVLYNISIQYNGVAVGSIILAINPVFTAIVSVIFCREKLSVRKIIALIINVVGCSLAATNGKIDGFTVGFIGIASGLAAAFGYSLTPVVGRITAQNNKPSVISAYSFGFATIFLLLYSALTSTPLILNGEVLTYGFFYALIPTCISYLLYYNGLKHITESSRIPVIASAEIACATILGIVIFHEDFGVFCIIGIVLVLLSSAIMCEKSKN